LEHGTI